MFKNKEICAVILARGNSHRLPGKNIINLCGLPLIAYTIKASLRSKYIDRVICSTDSIKIARVARKYGAEIPYLRPRRLSLDNTSSVDSLIHALRYLEKNEGYLPEIIVLLQSTSPLRTEKHIDEAVRLFCAKRPKSLVAVKRIKNCLSQLRVILRGRLIQLNESLTEKLSDMRDCYCANGALYIATPGVIQKYKTFFTDNTAAYIMDELSSVDIDTGFDLKLAEYIIRKKFNKSDKRR